MKRIWIVLAVLLVVGLTITFGLLGYRSSQQEVEEPAAAPETVPASLCDVTQTVTAPGSVISMGGMRVWMPITARVEAVAVQPGDSVQAGQALIGLDPVDVSLAVAQARVNLAQAAQELADATRARNGLTAPRGSSLTREQAGLHYASALKQYAAAEQAYRDASGIPESDPRRLAALDMLLAARRERDRALADMNWLNGQPSANELLAAEAELGLAQARMDLAQETLALLEAAFVTPQGISATLRAPSGGTIVEVNVGSGETAAGGTLLLSLVAPDQVEVQVSILEEDYPFVEIGQRVELYFDALPEAIGVGAVDRILPMRLPGDRPLYRVFITLDDVPEHLVDGMTADASIVIAERSGVLCLPRALVRASSGPSAAVTVWNGQTTETRQIELGLRGDVYIEILSGLAAGELVVTR